MAYLAAAFVLCAAQSRSACAFEIQTPGDVVPTSIHAGQTLIVSPGGLVPNNFGAYEDSRVFMSGGTLGSYFSAHPGSLVDISGGTIGSNFRVFPTSNVTITGGKFNGMVVLEPDAELRIDGGEFPNALYLGWASKLHLAGGSVGYGMNAWVGNEILVSGGDHLGFYYLYEGSKLSMTGGSIATTLQVLPGSRFTMSGGRLGYANVIYSGAKAEISGGEIEELTIDGAAHISGGTFGDRFKVGWQSEVTIAGGDFRVDGVPVAQFDLVGSSIKLENQFQTLSGTLADGTPFVISNSDVDQVPSNRITLQVSNLPTAPIGQIPFPLPPSTRGIRAGQSIYVQSGDTIPRNFNAGHGSTVRIDGGNVGENLEAADAHVIITGGNIAHGLGTFGASTLRITGGEFRGFVNAADQSTVDISGDPTFKFLLVGGTSRATISGGNYTSGLIVGSNASLALSGGRMTSTALAGTAIISGGSLGSEFETSTKSDLTFVGTEFYVDGTAVAGLETVGNEVQILPDRFTSLTGTLADGTPFAFRYGSDRFSQMGNYLTLRAAHANTTPEQIVLPRDPVPLGVRRGQALVVNSSATLPDHFNAGRGSSVNLTGGQIGNNFETEGAQLVLDGGKIGDDYTAFHDSDVIIRGGSLGAQATMIRTKLQISGGEIGENFTLENGSIANISGGTFAYGFTANRQTEMNVTGGQFESFGSSGIVNLNGGVFGDDFHVLKAAITFSGNDFRIDGEPIDFSEMEGDVWRDSVWDHGILTGTLADGTPFSFAVDDNDRIQRSPYGGGTYFRPVSLPPVEPSVIQVRDDSSPKYVRDRQTLILEEGGVLPRNFHAGAGSRVQIHGGHVGENFEVTAAIVDVIGGRIGDGFDAFPGSVVNISGGAIGNEFNAFKGSVINISGGKFGNELSAFNGSAIHLFGTNFQLDHVPIGELLPGQKFVIPTKYSTLSGILADGTPFSFGLNKGDRDQRFNIDSEVLLTVSLPLVPEPNSLVLVLAGLIAATLPPNRARTAIAFNCCGIATTQ